MAGVFLPAVPCWTSTIKPLSSLAIFVRWYVIPISSFSLAYSLCPTKARFIGGNRFIALYRRSRFYVACKQGAYGAGNQFFLLLYFPIYPNSKAANIHSLEKLLSLLSLSHSPEQPINYVGTESSRLRSPDVSKHQVPPAASTSYPSPSSAHSRCADHQQLQKAPGTSISNRWLYPYYLASHSQTAQ